MAAEPRSLQVDGVDVLHFPSDDPTTRASLVFGAGERGETLPTQGSLHALEHLVISRLRRTSLDINGSVDKLTTQFTADGGAADVTAYLARLCLELSEPQLAGLASEARVLRAEDPQPRSDAPLWVLRFGHRDLGLGFVDPPDPELLDKKRLATDAGRWFRADRALLVVSGPLPEQLRLPLPAGPSEPLPTVAPRRWSGLVGQVLDAPAVGVSLVLPAETASQQNALSLLMLEDRLEAVLRHEHGLAYHIFCDSFPATDGQTVATLFAEPREGKGRETSHALVDTVLMMLSDGPSADELELAQRRLGSRRRSGTSRPAQAVSAAIGRWYGHHAPDFDEQLMSSLGTADLGRFLSSVGRDAAFQTVEGTESLLAGRGIERVDFGPAWPSMPTGAETYRPPLIARAMDSTARSARLASDDVGLWLTLDGRVSRISWNEVGAVLTLPPGQDDLVVVGLDGTATMSDRST